MNKVDKIKNIPRNRTKKIYLKTYFILWIFFIDMLYLQGVLRP